MVKPNNQSKYAAASSVKETARYGDSPASVQTRSKTVENVITSDDISPAAVSEERIVVKLSQLLDIKFKEFKEFEDGKFKDFETRVVSSLNSRMQAVEEDISVLKQKVTDLECNNIMLQQQVKDISRLQRLTDAMISGIPYMDGERPAEIVRKIAAYIDHPISSFVDAYRLPAKQSNKHTAILVRFSSALEKKSFIGSFYKHDKVKLRDVDGLGFSSDSRIFVNESLTTQNSLLLKEAIGLRKLGHLQKVLTRDGIVYVIGHDGVRKKVKHISELQEMCSAALRGA